MALVAQTIEEQKNEYKEQESTSKKAMEAIENADAIVLGMGAGMSASGGLNYADPNLVKQWFPEYQAIGLNSLLQIMSKFWTCRKDMDEEYIASYWGYWARHIDNIRYKTELTEPYKNIYKILKDKNYFVITTNADGQTQKSELDQAVVFSPQGNYAAFQCVVPCKSDEIYPNEQMIKNMILSIKNGKIEKTLIPKCPNCKHYLTTNLRIDDTFVEKPHMAKQQEYQQFTDNNGNKNIVFWELGVGFNTAGIIRYPFERFTHKLPHATLIRVNRGRANVPKEIQNKSICIDRDINAVLIDMLQVKRKAEGKYLVGGSK
eukprot:156077_1